MSSLSFWKPGTAAPGSSLDRVTQEQEGVIPSAPSDNSLSLQAQRERLPIAKYRTYCTIFSRLLRLTAFRPQAPILRRTVSSHYCRWANGIRENYTYVSQLRVYYTLAQFLSPKNFPNICRKPDGLLKVM